ncbi:ROK family protein [Rufibacter psychrotolerans]|uniref:ROK family protein n=1 Tax=Rufibacter psychrotolerans TaxID=2812556 RepID=UPI0019681A7A|nr:ROK family protein [Rufibacter sp. SYSU D00308]
MTKTFFAEIEGDNPSGVAFRNVNQKKKMIAYFANTGNATIAEVAKELSFSVPKATSLLGELAQEGLVKVYGKVNSTGGRKPNIFGLAPDAGFFLGIDVKQYHINICMTDFQNNMVSGFEQFPYHLMDNQESLDELCQIINRFIENLAIDRDKILGIGINLSGRVNHTTGYSYSFFNFHEDPLSKILEAELGISVFLENDSRAMAYGEFCSENVKNEKNVIFLNLDYGIGMGMMINGHLYYGKSGYSGEFGHIPIFDNGIICQCGKKGCLETEAAGWALIEMAKESILAGTSTLLTKNEKNLDELRLEDIIDAVHQDDVMSIELMAKIGDNIGRGVAVLINLFNPDLVIIGGSLSSTEEFILLPIKSAIKKYSLSLVNNDTQLKMSMLGERAGVIGACLLARDRLLSLEY